MIRNWFRLVSLRNLLFRLQVARRGAALSPTIYFVAHNRNHVRLMIGAAERLSAAGHLVRFVHFTEEVGGGLSQPELARLGVPSISFNELRPTIRPRDILVTGNDFGPWRPYKRFLEAINRGLVTVIGIIEGARAIRPHRYERVDYVLAPGPAAREHFSQPVHVVGSPVVETQLSRCGGGARDGSFVLINFKGDPDGEEDRRSLDAVIDACNRIGVDCKVSVHPNIAMRIANSSLEDFADLLPEALVLVTRPSTTAYEAIACGIPVVIFPPAHPLVEFASPSGAFPVCNSAEDIEGHIQAAIAARPDYKQKGAAFLGRYLSIDPKRRADERIAVAIARIGKLALPDGQPS